MTDADIRHYVAGALPGVEVQVAAATDGSPEIAWGDTFFFYDPEGALDATERFPFATIVTKDYGEFDNASNLDRDGVYRLNFSLTRETFKSLFDDRTEHDFTALDRLMPHPIYGVQHWVSVLNPSAETFEKVKPLLAEAHGLAVGRYRPPRTARG